MEPDQQAVWDEIKAERTDAPAEKPLPVVEKPEVVEAVEPPKGPTTDELLRDALAKIEKIEGRQRNVEGHIGGLTRNQTALKETMAAAQAAATVAKEAPTTKQVTEALSSPKEWEALKSEFPEWSDATEKFLDAKLARIAAPVDIKAIEQRVTELVAGETKAVRAEVTKAALEAVFPDWEADVNTPAYADWIKGQKPEMQALAASSRLGDAAKLLKAFSEHQASPNRAQQILEERKQRLTAASAAPKGVRPMVTKTPDQMNPQELWAYEKRLRAKRQPAFG